MFREERPLQRSLGSAGDRPFPLFQRCLPPSAFLYIYSTTTVLYRKKEREGGGM